MAQFLKVTIDPNQLRRAKEALDPKAYKLAIRTAVRGATKQMREIIRQRVQEHSYIKQKYINRSITVKGATGDPPAGMVTVSKDLLPLAAFKFRATKRGGVQVTISPDRTPLTLKHAFKAKMKSGHLGLFLRARRLPGKGPNANAKIEKGKNKGQPKFKLTKQGIAGRFAIDEQFGPDVLQVVELPKVLGQIIADGQEDLARRVDEELNLAQAKAATSNP